MAGSMSEKDIREKIPKCPNHGIPCVIKTGTKNNATHGKSFYICNNTQERCTYSSSAEELEATVCPEHMKMVELKAFAKKSDGLRCYYRCVYGKEKGSAWCGNVTIKPSINKLQDITNHPPIRHTEKKPVDKDNVTKPKILPVKVHPPATKEHSNNTNNQVEYIEKNNVYRTFQIPVEASLNPCNNIVEPEHHQQNKDTIETSKTLQSEIEKSKPMYGNSSFHIPRNARVSDISEASSLDSTGSSSSSRHSDVSCSGGELKEDGKLSNTIEILSSDDEDDDDDYEVRENDNTRMELPSMASKIINVESSCETVEFLEQNLKMKMVIQNVAFHRKYKFHRIQEKGTSQDVDVNNQNLLDKIRHTAPDGGRKLQENIYQLTDRLEKMRAKESESVGCSAMSSHQLSMEKINSLQNIPTSIKLPSMATTDNRTIPIMPQHAIFNLNQNRQAPLFGGRMTESRLKEVGRITKGAIETLHKSLDSCPAPHEEADDPEGLKVTLMTHQKQAMAWLLWREKQTPSGGILADDMGLGKTLTMISLTLKSKHDNLSQITELASSSPLVFSKCTVIVCPASLVHQWYKEIEKRVAKLRLKVCLYHGPNRERRINKLANHDIVLTTYNIVSIEGKPYVAEEKEKPKAALSEWLDSSAPRKADEGPLFKIFWRRIVLDEGHTIKNHKTATSIAICHLEAESRWIVTGTPIQNQTMDLFSLIKFLRVSPFNELKVWKREVDNKSSSGTKRMNSIVKSLLLRRTKDQTDKKTGKPLVSLPKRSAVVHRLKLSEKENAVYGIIQSYSKNMFTQFLDNRKNAGSHSTHAHSTKEVMPTHVLGMPVDVALSMFGLFGVNATNNSCLLVLVLRLRQCCAHMSLMCEPLDADLCKSEGIDVDLEEQFGNMSIQQDTHEQGSRPRELKPTFRSTKISCLLSKLKELRLQSNPEKPTKSVIVHREKVLHKTLTSNISVIVSQWTRMLDTIAHHLKMEGFNFEFITGSVNAKKRADIVETFNTERNPEIMLVSLKAGGVGLNLIGGSNLFLLDQHWNPALEDQACDRIYRVGQQNDVVIHSGKSQKLTLDDLKTIFGVM